jgi:hypothetical protein
MQYEYVLTMGLGSAVSTTVILTNYLQNREVRPTIVPNLTECLLVFIKFLLYQVSRVKLLYRRFGLVIGFTPPFFRETESEAYCRHGHSWHQAPLGPMAIDLCVFSSLFLPLIKGGGRSFLCTLVFSYHNLFHLVLQSFSSSRD